MDACEAILSWLILDDGDSARIGCEDDVVYETLSAIVESKQGGAPVQRQTHADHVGSGRRSGRSALNH